MRILAFTITCLCPCYNHESGNILQIRHSKLCYLVWGVHGVVFPLNATAVVQDGSIRWTKGIKWYRLILLLLVSLSLLTGRWMSSYRTILLLEAFRPLESIIIIHCRFAGAVSTFTGVPSAIVFTVPVWSSLFPRRYTAPLQQTVTAWRYPLQRRWGWGHILALNPKMI
jgi:hypothetical protein